MAHEILMSVENGLLRVAQLEDGVLVSMQAAPLGKADTETSMVGQIYLARVERVVERLQAAFVDIGFEKSAFLGALNRAPSGIIQTGRFVFFTNRPAVGPRKTALSLALGVRPLITKSIPTSSSKAAIPLSKSPS